MYGYSGRSNYLPVVGLDQTIKIHELEKEVDSLQGKLENKNERLRELENNLSQSLKDKELFKKWRNNSEKLLQDFEIKLTQTKASLAISEQLCRDYIKENEILKKTQTEHKERMISYLNSCAQKDKSSVSPVLENDESLVCPTQNDNESVKVQSELQIITLQLPPNETIVDHMTEVAELYDQIEMMKIHLNQRLTELSKIEIELKKITEENVKYICAICMDKNITIILLPCMHFILCEECCNKIKERICPECRTPISGELRCKLK